MKQKDYTVTIMVVVGLFLLVMILIVAVTPERPAMKPIVTFMHKSGGMVSYAGRAHITAIDQTVPGKVVILSVALKENGYVIIHKEEKGKAGKIIGVSKMLAPGIYSNSAIVLSEVVAPGQGLIAMLHVDNGDGVFSDEKDGPMKGGDMMMDDSGMVEFMAI